MVLRGLALSLVTVFLTGCVARVAAAVVTHTAKTTYRAIGAAARVTMDGTRAASHTFTRSFPKG